MCSTQEEGEKGHCRHSQLEQALQGGLIYPPHPRQGQALGTEVAISAVTIAESFSCSQQMDRVRESGTRLGA